MKTSHLIMLGVIAAASLNTYAALDIGEDAPKFLAPAAIAGQELKFSLADELKKGPVVVYFFPAAFTTGCSIEAHNFAEAIDQSKAAGATVIGISHDDIDTQKKFSMASCSGKFAVAADPEMSVAKSYDAVLTTRPEYANRISYVIAPDGKIVYRYTSLNPTKHVENTLNAVKELHAPARQ